MGIKARWARVLLRVGLAGGMVLLVLFAVVQGQQRLLRYRCARLLADFQGIRLHESTWADAQRLMTRWGAWGHYEGTCTAVDCGYTITLTDAAEGFVQAARSDFEFAVYRRLFWLYDRLGGRGVKMQVSFLVQDGRIWRSSVGLHLDVPAHVWKRDDEYGYALLLGAKASQSLRQAERGPRILGGDEQLAAHPNYKVGRPGGCMICMMVEVTFTPAISPAELREISGYDLSCVTRFHPCLFPQDVLPAEEAWNLYPREQASAPEPAMPSAGCVLPMMVRARDAEEVLLVDVIARTRIEPKRGAVWPDDQVVERARVRVVEVLKSGVGHRAGEVMEVTPWWGDSEQGAERLEAGKRTLLFVYRTEGGRRLGLNGCSVAVDSTEVRRALGEGFAQNDGMRRKEVFGQSIW